MRRLAIGTSLLAALLLGSVAITSEPAPVTSVQARPDFCFLCPGPGLGGGW